MTEEQMKESCAASRNVFDGKVLHVFVDDIYLPNGKMGYREYIKHGGAVAVLPLTREGEVLCVKQYRYAIGRVTLEIPAGKLDSADEIHKEAAERELREETGARTGRMTFLGTYIGSPAILDEKIDIYLAEDLSFGDTDFDEDEFINVEKIPLSRLLDAAMDGSIMDGKTLFAIFKVNELLRRREERA